MTDPKTWSKELDDAMQLAMDKAELGVDLYEWWVATGEALEMLKTMHEEIWDYVREFELNRDAS